MHKIFEESKNRLRSSTPGWGVLRKTLKMVFTAPQSVLVIMSLIKGNVLKAIKRSSSYLIQ